MQQRWVPLMVTAPGALVVLLSPAGAWTADQIGRRALIIAATFLLRLLGRGSFVPPVASVILMTRLASGLVEAFILIQVS